jgi:hypothetical protein
MAGLHPWQVEVLKTFDAHVARFFVLEWHRRARKTTLAINLLIRECCEHANRSYVYVAPTYKQARGIVWDDPNMLFTYLPDRAEMGWRKNEQKLSVQFANGSLLRICGADDPDSLRGFDAHGLVVDEWALIAPLVWFEIFRPMMAQDPSRWAAFLFTPKPAGFHALDMLADAKSGKSPDWFGQTLRASQSGLISADELLKAKAEMPAAMYDQEFECAHITDEESVLITSRMLEDLREYPTPPGVGKRLVACDPSLGGDECVAYFGIDGEVRDSLFLHERDEMKIAGYLAVFAKKNGCDAFIIDQIGMKGIADRLSEMGLRVIYFQSAEQAMEESRFINRRAEAWWSAMRDIQDHLVSYPEDRELRRQLTSVRYRIVESNGKIAMERKENVKKPTRLGCSPDRADAFVMLRYGMRFAAAAAGQLDPFRRGRGGRTAMSA